MRTSPGLSAGRFFLYCFYMSSEEFEALVEEGYRQLSSSVREKIKNVALLIEDEPSEDVRVRERLSVDETLLGYYQGIPLSERGENYGVGGTMPDTITLYRKSIEEAAHADGVPVTRVIAETIWHEFAHHFGMDEHEVRSREDVRHGRI